MDINLSIFLISHHFNRKIFDQVYIQTKGSFMNYLQKPRGGRGEGGEGEGESVQIWIGMEGVLFVCAYTLHTHLLFLRYWDVLTQLKFIESTHEVNNEIFSTKHNNSVRWVQ